VDTDIDRKFKPRFATGFANVSHGTTRGLILKFQSSAFSGKGQAAVF
jgi:hypothetical protein